MTCRECQARLEPTASGLYRVCPAGHGKLHPPLIPPAPPMPPQAWRTGHRRYAIRGYVGVFRKRMVPIAKANFGFQIIAWLDSGGGGRRGVFERVSR